MASLLIFTPQNPNLQIKSLFHLLSSSSSSSLCFRLSNPISSFSLSISQTSKKFKQLGFHGNHLIRSSADGFYYNRSKACNAINGEEQVELVECPKPTEIPWSKELVNSVHLIGSVGAPIQIKSLDSGKVVAWSRLAIRKSPTETTWINLTFWNDLAHVAFQHVEKGQQIYVSGRLVSDTVQGDNGKPRIYYKVVVKELNFIEKGAFQEKEAGKTGNLFSKTGASTQELWQAYFANPEVWWDNRKNKRTAKHPDFKHKDTGEALWLDAKYNPPWVRSQLAILDNKRESQEANNSYAPVQFISSDDLEFF